jgi:hypothetical protein
MTDSPIKLKVTAEQDFEPWGVYVWQFYDGGFFANDEGDFMYIASEPNDPYKVKLLEDAAKAHGVYDIGFAKFLPGRRPVSEEEFEAQRQRLLMGLDPDPLQPSVYREKHGRD